jgi:hypothetical protein
MRTGQVLNLRQSSQLEIDLRTGFKRKMIIHVLNFHQSSLLEIYERIDLRSRTQLPNSDSSSAQTELLSGCLGSLRSCFRLVPPHLPE